MENNEVLRNSVTVFGITFHGSTNICGIERFQSCMGKAIDNIEISIFLATMRVHLLYKIDPFAVFAGFRMILLEFYFHKLFFLDFISLFYNMYFKETLMS